VKVDGALLKEARKRASLSREELADAICLNPGVVVGLEATPRTEVKDSVTQSLAEALGIEAQTLTTHPSPPPPVDPDLRPEDLGYEI